MIRFFGFSCFLLLINNVFNFQTSTLEEVESLVEDARKELMSRPYDEINLDEKFDRQEKILKRTNGNEHTILTALPKMLRDRPQMEQACLLDHIMENNLLNVTIYLH